MSRQSRARANQKRRKKARGHGTPKAQASKPAQPAAQQVLQAVGELPNGNLQVVEMQQQWRSAYGFWMVWDTCSMLSASGAQQIEHAMEKNEAPFLFVENAEPDSPEDWRMSVGAQMSVSLSAIPELARAQIITVDPGDVMQLTGASQDRVRVFSVEPLRFNPVYLDLIPKDRTHVTGVRIDGYDEPWRLAGVLASRNESTKMLTVTVFGAEPDAGPVVQPLGRLLFADREHEADTQPGEVFIGLDDWVPVAPTVNPQTGLGRRSEALVQMTKSVMSMLAFVQGAQLVPELRSPAARERAQQKGEAVALTFDRRSWADDAPERPDADAAPAANDTP